MLLLCAAVAKSLEASQQAASQPLQRQANHSVDKDIWYSPDVYDDDSPGVTPATLIKESKPSYTREAMDARIEGLVRLECIVEEDGSIGPIRVRHSLDAVKGLDEEAVKSVRKWQFKPAQKNGVPVRSRIAVEIAFTLLEAGYRPEVGWPEDFRLTPGKTDMAKDRLTEDVLPSADVLIRVKYPRDWVVVKGVSPDQLVTIQRIDNRDARACAVLAPKATEMDLMVPVRNEALHAFEKSLRLEAAGSPSGSELKRVGQINAGHLWIWSENWRKGLDVSSAPSAEGGRLQSTFEGMRLWTFMTTDSLQELNVVCYVMVPRGSSGDDMKQTVHRAAEDFAAILTGITVRPR